MSNEEIKEQVKAKYGSHELWEAQIDDAIDEAIRLKGDEMKVWKDKYDKCIEVIKRFDAGIISMYEL